MKKLIWTGKISFGLDGISYDFAGRRPTVVAERHKGQLMELGVFKDEGENKLSYSGRVIPKVKNAEKFYQADADGAIFIEDSEELEAGSGFELE